MKKTYNINISGFPFVIDEDAYVILDSYLATLSQICQQAGQQETAADIEQRIAEIFAEDHIIQSLEGTHSASRIITRADVEEVIARMGAPDEIVDIEMAPTSCGSTVPPPPPQVAAPAAKRLFRDIDHKVIGGVCAGLALYLGIDVVWVRIIMVILAFISGSTVALIYIVLWIVIPPAKTPLEKMQMMGVNPSMHNVGKIITGTYDYGTPSSSGTAPNFGRIAMMFLTVIGLLIVGALLVTLSVAFVGMLIAWCVLPAANIEIAPDMARARLVLGCVIGGSLVIGIPLFLLFRALMGSLTEKSYPPFSPAQRLLIWIPWGLGLVATIIFASLLS